MESEREVGFLELLRVNPLFRRYWTANAISMLGEWFNTVAMFVLIDSLTDSALGLGFLFVLRMFSLAFPQVFTGMLADRFSRKWLMVWANLFSAVAVLILLTVDGPGDVWLVYVIASVLMMLHAVYIPAENAALPSMVKENELLTANALNSGTWSASLAIGAAIGGFVVAAHGVEVAFIVNAATFVLAAAIIGTMTIPQKKYIDKEGGLWANTIGQISDGFRIILTTPPVRRIITAKALWGIFGGGMVYMLVLVGEDIGLGGFAAGIGVLFAARGIGTGLGPILARYVFTDRGRWPFLLGWLVSACGLGYAAIAWLEWSPWITLLVVAAHAASGANWVLSTVLLQERSEDEWRGRMFSTDFLLMTTVHGLSTLAAALIIEYGPWELREVLQIFAVGQILSGLIWVALVSPGERRDATLKQVQATS
ncbi:MAG TPA: MFS transporter [Candidatus Poseidoniales archaeon]|nr:MFS transporter [Candidatus Poseidoniales archaeon]